MMHNYVFVLNEKGTVVIHEVHETRQSVCYNIVYILYSRVHQCTQINTFKIWVWYYDVPLALLIFLHREGYSIVFRTHQLFIPIALHSRERRRPNELP